MHKGKLSAMLSAKSIILQAHQYGFQAITPVSFVEETLMAKKTKDINAQPNRSVPAHRTERQSMVESSQERLSRRHQRDLREIK